MEAQLQAIIWHCLKKHNTTAIVEASYDPENNRKKLDLLLKTQGVFYAIEIKRNGLDLENHGKNFSDSIDRFQDDFDKLNFAQKKYDYKKYL